ncbi:nitrous oxide reductase accessory protein NosL [Cysteiniphilum sp. 6C5]
MLFSVVILFAAALSGCGRQSETQPQDLTKADICSLCGMVILNYSGPHVQIVWKDGKHTFYCDLFEAMSIILNKPDRERMAAIYVQNFDDKAWASYDDEWMLVKDLYFVIDSKQRSAMGISYVPFKSLNNAKIFEQKHGGKLVQFKDITQQVVQNSIDLMQSDPQRYGPMMHKKHKNN